MTEKELSIKREMLLYWIDRIYVILIDVCGFVQIKSIVPQNKKLKDSFLTPPYCYILFSPNYLTVVSAVSFTDWCCSVPCIPSHLASLSSLGSCDTYYW